jgi:hypothetical protein
MTIKEKKFLVADTEATGLGRKCRVYDLAYIIATRKRIILERSFLIREIITNPREMLGALNDDYWRQHFGGKIFSHYVHELDAGNLKLYPWRDIVETMRDDMRTHEVAVFSAYNLDFDKRALGYTQHAICDGGKILDYRPDMLCLWDFACQTVCRTPLYHEIAHRMGLGSGWLTEKGNVRTTAEKVHAFLSGVHDFVESHTALADAQIETEILQRLLKLKKRIPYNNPDVSAPWRRAQFRKGRLFDGD